MAVEISSSPKAAGLSVVVVRGIQGVTVGHQLSSVPSNTSGLEISSKGDSSQDKSMTDVAKNKLIEEKLLKPAKEFLQSSDIGSSDGDVTADDAETASFAESPITALSPEGSLMECMDRGVSNEGSITANGTVVNALRQYIDGQEREHTPPGHISGAHAFILPVTDAAAAGGQTSTMRVKYSKIPGASEAPAWIYPYARMSHKKISYRGYPVDGPSTLLKSKKWRVQIVGSAIGAPPEPLPQFPQQELLGATRDGDYFGLDRIELTPEQVEWNSGQRYLSMAKSAVPAKPTSRSFFTSGYHRGSAIEVMKPFPETIYHTVVNGSTVEVPVEGYAAGKA